MHCNFALAGIKSFDYHSVFYYQSGRLFCRIIFFHMIVGNVSVHDVLVQSENMPVICKILNATLQQMDLACGSTILLDRLLIKETNALKLNNAAIQKTYAWGLLTL